MKMIPSSDCKYLSVDEPVTKDTSNRLKATQYTNLGDVTLTAPGQEKKYPCFVHQDFDTITIEKIYQGRDVFCEVYVPQKQDHEHPVVITINSITNQIMGGNLRFGFGKIQNYFVEKLKYNGGANEYDDGNRNTYTHVDIMTQTMTQSLGFRNTYKMRRWFAMGHIKPPVDLSTLPQPTKVETLDLQAGVFHERYEWKMQWSAPIDIDFFYYFIDAPHGIKMRNYTHNERGCTSACNFYDQPTGMGVFHSRKEQVDSLLSFHFGYAHSPFYGVDSDYELFFTHQNEIISYYKGTIKTKSIKANVTLQTLEKNITTGGTFEYQAMVYYSYPFFGNAAWLRFLIPANFPAILDCRTNFGFRKLEIDKLDQGDTRCVIDNATSVQTDPATGVNKLYRKVEIYDIDHFSTFEFNVYENIFLFTLEMENPLTEGWTDEVIVHWFYDPERTFIYSINQFSSPVLDPDFSSFSLTAPLENRLQIVATMEDRQGKYWIGESVENIHFVDIQTNRQSFEDRKVHLGEFFEMDLQFVTKKDFGLNERSIFALNLAKSFHFPIGGSFSCQFGHAQFDQFMDCKSFAISGNNRLVLEREESTVSLSSGKCYIIKVPRNGSSLRSETSCTSISRASKPSERRT